MIAASPSPQAFFLAGNSTALLFIHGFSASPSEMYPAAAMINASKGYTISAPLLPGHGTVPEDLNKTGWTDWYEAIEREINNLQQKYEEVIIVGLSMGGMLALHAGCRLKGIKAVVCINVPIFNSQPWLTLLSPVIRYIKPYFPKKMDRARAELEEQGRFSYEVIPVQAFMSMMKLRRVVMQELKNLTAPLLVMQSMQDESVKIKSADYIINHAGCSRTILVKLPQSRHIATMGPEKETIAQAIIKFIDS